MAEREDVALTEDALFDQAIEPTQTPEPTPPPPPEPEPKPAPQDEPKPDGKPSPLDTKQPGETPAADDEPMVPSWRLKEITEERRQAQSERDALKQERDRLAFEQQEFRRRLAQLEKPAEALPAPDPLLDPKGFSEMLNRQVNEALAAERLKSSLRYAQKTYREEFDQAWETARKQMNPAMQDVVQRSDDPGEALIGWYRELKMRSEVGNDLSAYKKKISDDMLKDPEFRKRAIEAWRTEAQGNQSNGRPLLAPSLNGISRSSAALRASQADLSDDDLWTSTTN